MSFPHYTPLHQLNTLVAGITQVNPLFFDGIQSAINFCIYEGEPLHDKSDLAESALRLIAIYEGEGKSLAFAHCDLSSYSPLWDRLHILEALEQLAEKPRALLLITGLKQTFYKNHRWTPQSKKAYAEAIRFIESLVNKHSLNIPHLHILFT
jgi:hypothetical protein